MRSPGRKWGQGLVSEAARAVLACAFTALALAKVYTFADVRNVGSWRVMEKIGMHREGLLRQHRILHGERVDDVWYGLLRGEWDGQTRP